MIISSLSITGDHSFIPVLEAWLSKLSPKKVLEWGPGKSTALIHQYCPSAEIISIENQEGFAKAAENAHPYARIIHCPIPAYGPSLYSCWPLLHAKGKRFDLVFVDGRQRVSCLVTARECLTDGGVIILHDAGRPHYAAGKRLFQIVEERLNTAVLRP